MINSDLKQRAEAIIRAEEALEDAKADLKALYDAAKSDGYTATVLKRAIKIHRLNVDKRARHDSEQMDLEMYLAEIEGRREAAE